MSFDGIQAVLPTHRPPSAAARCFLPANLPWHWFGLLLTTRGFMRSAKG